MFREQLVIEFVWTGKEATPWQIKKVGETLTTFWYYHAFWSDKEYMIHWDNLPFGLVNGLLSSEPPGSCKVPQHLSCTRVIPKWYFTFWLLFIYVLWSNNINNGHINFYQWLARWFKPTIYLKAFSFFLKGALYHRVSWVVTDFFLKIRQINTHNTELN